MASSVQVHQSVQMLWQVLFRYTNPSKCCGKFCSDTPNRPSVETCLLYSYNHVYELQNSFHTCLYRNQLKTEPGRRATSTALPSSYTISNTQACSYRLWQWVSEATFSYSHTCLTPGEQIIKYCLKSLPINCPYYTSSLMKAAQLSPPVIGVYMEHYIITVTQSGLICWVQHTSLSFEVPSNLTF